MRQSTLINPVAYLQAHIVRLFMERHKLSHKEFLALNDQKDILGFLRLGYEPFHVTGDDGILEELDAYVPEAAITKAQKAFAGAAADFGVETEDDVQRIVNEIRYGGGTHIK